MLTSVGTESDCKTPINLIRCGLLFMNLGVRTKQLKRSISAFLTKQQWYGSLRATKSVAKSQEKSTFLIFLKLRGLCRKVASQIILQKFHKKT